MGKFGQQRLLLNFIEKKMYLVLHTTKILFLYIYKKNNNNLIP